MFLLIFALCDESKKVFANIKQNHHVSTEKLGNHLAQLPYFRDNSNPLQCSCLENPMDGGAW